MVCRNSESIKELECALRNKENGDGFTISNLKWMLGNFITDKDVSVDRYLDLPRDIENTMTYPQSEVRGSTLGEDQCVYG